MNDEESAPDLSARMRELDPERRAALVRKLKNRRTTGPQRRPQTSPTVLSYEQERLWLLDQLTPGLTAYNASRVLHLEGPVHVNALQRALNDIVERHEVLRTRVETVDGAATPSTRPPGPVALDVVNLESGTPVGMHDAITVVQEFLARPFDLSGDLLLRGLLVRLKADDHVLALCVHHIASDGTSRQLLLDDLQHLYVGYAQGGSEPTLEPPALQFSDVAAWQRDQLNASRMLDHSAFWTEYLAGAPPTIDLPFDRARPASQSYEGERLTTRLPESLVTALGDISRQEGATPFMGALALFAVLLSRLSGQKDLVLGTPVNGRVRPELQNVMGMLSDTLPIRIDLSEDPGFSALVRRVRTAVTDSLAHRDTPFQRIVEIVRPERDPSRPPLVQVLINSVGSRDAQPTAWGSLTVTPINVDPHTSQVDLSLALIEVDGSGDLELVWEWCTALWDRQSIVRVAAQFETLLVAALEAPERPVSQLRLLRDVERGELLRAASTTGEEIPQTCVPQLFSQQVAARPNDVAVRAVDGSLTYAELEMRSDQLASRLAVLGIEKEDRVAVCLDRSVNLLVALLGIMKSGAAYVPVDPTSPGERVAYILGDAGAKVMVTTADLVIDLPSTGATLLFIEDVPTGPTEPVVLGMGPSPDDLAYVMYTSGSTGRPKGVMVEHRSLVNILTAMAAAPGLAPGEVLVSVTTPAFDISLVELLLPLITGATLVVASVTQTRDPLALAQLIEGSSANLCQATPATWQMLIESGWTGHPGLRIVCGGEAFGASLVNALTDRVAEVWNFYGPTETTVWSVCTRLEAGTIDPVPMGLPLANTSCFVLDQWQEPVPTGVIGELFIGGAGVARGYLGRADLTAEKFVTNSFDGDGDAGSRLYRTGDLVRWRSDGQLVFIGRTDHQVKLRGFRIELGEVESVLGDMSEIAHAVAIVREDVPNNRLLVAYVVPSGHSIDTKEVEEELRRRLPAYMVPSTIVPLVQLPLTPNGKIDRAALPQPTADLVSTGEYVLPSTPTEQAMAAVWGALVGSENLSATDNFFELGGHSLQATRLVSRIAESMNVVVPLETIFEQPVLWRFAAAVDQLLASQRPVSLLPSVDHADRSRHRIRSETLSDDPGRVQVVAYGGPGSDEGGDLLVFPASYAQERMWVLEQLEPGRALYNVPVARRIEGAVDTEALQAALNNLVRRHEVLRTSLADIDGTVTQVVHPNLGIQLVEFDAVGPDDPWALAQATTVAEALRPFDLARAPLARATLVRVGRPLGTPDPDDDPSVRQWIFCLTVHHSVIDGSSIELLMDELRTDYEALAGGRDIPPHATAPIDYGDYVLWQRGSAMRERETADLAFWRHNLEGAVTALDFPFDKLRPAVQSHRGGRCFRRVDSSVAAGLREHATELSATLFMVVLAGWTGLLARYCQQDEIIIGTPISGRQPAELESVVGLLVNTLPLRISLGDNPTFGELVQRTRSVLLAGMDHQSVPFERIVDAVHAGHDLSRHPVFQVMATMQPDQPGQQQFGNATMSSIPIDWGWSRFTDMSLVVMEHDGAIDLGLEYSADLLDSATAERLLGYLEGLLHAGIAEPDTPTSELVFNREEHHKLLVEWNATRQSYPSEKCIHELIAERTVKAPDAIAVEFGSTQLTYAELDSRANRLAHRLRQLGVDRDVIVAICIDRSLDMIVAVLAVLKAGGAYLPLDVGYPEDRLDFIIKDAGATVLLTSQEMAPRLKSHQGEVVLLDEDADLESYPSFAPETEVDPGNLAYLIYTSGSTGYPKGVLIEHESVVNLASVTATELELDATTRFLQFATLAFDASTLEILVALSVGATICLATRETVASTHDLMDLLVREKISAVLLPPSLLAILPEVELPHMRTLMSAGEACSTELARKWKGKVGGKLFNVYGPTETTCLATTQLIASVDEGAGETIPIGRPLGNVQAFVLDANLIPVPIGCPAELYIGGSGLARGYLGRPELTAERFVPHPFSSEPGARLYRTGDCVRWLPDGTLEYQGRLDNQVKFRGYRIELGEIEQTLMRHERILDAVVMVREEGEKRLVAYLVTDSDTELTYSEVRTFLRRTLPDYMVPSAIVVLDAMPLTSNLFKVDRAALPVPQAQSRPASNFVAPTGPIEELVARVWCEVLGLETIGVLDDVFELGANSLDAARVASKLRSRSFEVSLRSLFDFPTVDAVAREIVQALAAESGEGIDELLELAEEEAP